MCTTPSRVWKILYKKVEIISSLRVLVQENRLFVYTKIDTVTLEHIFFPLKIFVIENLFSINICTFYYLLIDDAVFNVYVKHTEKRK